MANYEPSLRLKHLNNLLLRVPCGGVDLLCHIKENEVVHMVEDDLWWKTTFGGRRSLHAA